MTSINIVPYDDDRDQLLAFFMLADDSAAEIATYLWLGVILVAREGDLIVGHLQIIGIGETGVFEIKSMAVAEKRQREGIGRRLMETALAHCRARDGHRLIVSTATADIDNLRFYQRQGFRMHKVTRDAFSPARGYQQGIAVDGIPIRVQVFLDLDLMA